ncbi:peptidase domain-containing ABC transporter [Kitasatospora sp. NPDC056138]|uniref:peptidase domain-containing ABC transporter n=1 Tax=Kitasatospora sp. NPDC056138 TaxID=3345724 RepID=UPI0035E0BE1C
MIRAVRRRLRRVPFRQQLSGTECAAACLAMVLAHHGREVSVADCRERLGPGRDGVGLGRLAAVAGEHELDAALERVADPLLDQGPEPTVVFLARHHLVVLEAVTRRGVVRLADPAQGRVRLTRAEFAEQYGGLRLRMAPGAGFVRQTQPWHRALVVRYLRDFVAAPGSRRLLGLIAVLAGMIQLLGLAMPFATQVIVDRVLPDHRTDLMDLLGTALAGTVLLHGALTLLRQLLTVALRVRSDAVLSQDFIDRLWRLPIRFFLQRSRGDLLLRVQSVSATREVLTQHVLTSLLDGGTLLVYVGVLIVLVPGYLPVVAALAALQGALLAGTYARAKRLAQRELTLRSEEQGYLVEALDAVLPVRANGIEGRVRAHWRTKFDRYQDAMAGRARLGAWIQAGQSTLTVLAPLALLWSGLLMVLHGRMTLGTMLAANSMALSVLGPVQTLVVAGQAFSTLRAQIERIYDVLDTPAEPAGTAALPGSGPLRVTVRGVSFRYHGDGPAVLDGVDFEVPPGGKLGIVGRTGSGKSTLGLVVLGLLRPVEGVVRLDGVPVDGLDPDRLRREFGAVLQELSLFNGTIKENLVLGRPEATQSEIEEACRIAGLLDDVRRLPMVFDTPVGEGGTALSAGQRQRLALARALIHRPRLLLLDEATSHLDPATERQVDAALERLAITRIVISHRLSAVRDAGRTLVLAGGRIVAAGRHEELVRRSEHYREMFAPEPDTAAAMAPAPMSGPAPTEAVR